MLYMGRTLQRYRPLYVLPNYIKDSLTQKSDLHQKCDPPFQSIIASLNWLKNIALWIFKMEEYKNPFLWEVYNIFQFSETLTKTNWVFKWHIHLVMVIQYFWTFRWWLNLTACYKVIILKLNSAFSSRLGWNSV
jgi:hypothetical protein